MGEAIGSLFTGIWGVWKEMFSVAVEIAPKVLHFIAWILSALIILPCVFVAGNLYPKWIEWGEDF
jgi:hypothetical protein